MKLGADSNSLTPSRRPTLLGEAGFSASQAATITALFQLGGTVSAIGVGWGIIPALLAAAAVAAKGLFTARDA